MTDDVKIDDNGNIIEPEILRTPKGRFRKGISGNPNGRRGKDGKSSSNKLNKTKMVTSLNKHGVASIEAIIRIAKKAEKAGEDKLALQGYTFVASEFTKATINQERMQMELKKLNKALQDEEPKETTEVDEVILSFQSYASGE